MQASEINNNENNNVNSKSQHFLKIESMRRKRLRGSCYETGQVKKRRKFREHFELRASFHLLCVYLIFNKFDSHFPLFYEFCYFSQSPRMLHLKNEEPFRDLRSWLICYTLTLLLLTLAFGGNICSKT